MFDAAKAKDFWVNEVSIANLFDQFDVKTLDTVMWTGAFHPSNCKKHFERMAKDILRGGENSLLRISFE